MLRRICLTMAVVTAMLVAFLPATTANAAIAVLNGTVTAQGGGPLANIGVTAYARDAVTGAWSVAATGVTDSAGRYTVNTAPGTYVIGFDDDSDAYAPEFYDDVLTRDAAKPVVVNETTPTTINAALVKAAGFTGKVQAVGGGPLADMTVSALVRSGGTWQPVNSTLTDATGAYRLLGLTEGSYLVEFKDARGRFVTKYYIDAATPAAATPQTLVRSEQRVLPGVQLAAVGSLSGTVRKAGAPVAQTLVVARRLIGTAWNIEASTRTKTDGTYTFTALTPGSYRIGVDGDTAAARVFYPASQTLAGASTLELGTGQGLTGLDLSVTAPAAISGTLTRVNGTTVVDGRVRAWIVNGTASERAREAVTNADGTYSIVGLAAGTYRLEFLEYDGRGNVVNSEWWDDKPVMSLSSPMTVAAGEAKTAINAVLGASTGYVATTAPTIAGTPVVGKTLTANPGTWAPTGGTIAYQWLGNGVELAGATKRSLPVTAAHAGMKLSVRVTVTGRYATGTATSAEVAVPAAAVAVPPPPAPVATPMVLVGKVAKVQGKARVGRTLMLVPGTYIPATVTVTYQWYAGSKLLAGKTGTSLKLTRKLAGKRIKVRIVASAPGHTSSTTWSLPSAKVKS